MDAREPPKPLHGLLVAARDARLAKLREHGVEIPDSEIQHEGTIGREIVAVLRERRKHHDAFLRDPSRCVRTPGREVDAEMGLVPAR